MAEEFSERIQISDKSGNVTVTLDAITADARVGAGAKGATEPTGRSVSTRRTAQVRKTRTRPVSCLTAAPAPLGSGDTGSTAT